MDDPFGFLDCPAWLDANGESRCGFPAEVQSRYIAESTDGPVDCAVIRCPVGHRFNGPIESLALEPAPARRAEAGYSRA
jgi:hypothetical protein